MKNYNLNIEADDANVSIKGRYIRIEANNVFIDDILDQLKKDDLINYITNKYSTGDVVKYLDDEDLMNTLNIDDVKDHFDLEDKW